ncbi:XkdF-like putative serine protease domain-containing protein [Petroclostridium sp. X23]|uniref:XkdF-like putative serine protease domain-containing protein n=1 Tax=Petroclostridium sp. X23 TaxID=3045146 RepID=UPI0024AE6930|nr:XkdF-like putative serine protease domain-containing protein [Petroclostridium sp. X23]WHH59159.1 XkdF-like putative serine protease domain-containing protein [Petroclostridium sp. X23]
MSKIAKSFEVSIAKVDEVNRIVEGVVYRPSKVFKADGTPTDYIDSQGDWMTEDDVKKACHKFAKKLTISKSGKTGVDKHHNEKAGYGVVVENYIAKADIPDIDAKAGDWCAAVEVTDEATWKQVQKREITGFSMGGNAVYIPVEGGEEDATND